MAVLSLSGVVSTNSVRVGGDKMDEAIIHYVKRSYNLLIGEQSAEQVKRSIGSACPGGEPRQMEVKGRDLVSGIPRILELKSDEVREALVEPVNVLVEAVKVALERTPPELAADIVDRGIMLVGGGSLLSNFPILLRNQTGLPILLADDPFTAVVQGAGMCLDDPELLSKVAIRV